MCVVATAEDPPHDFYGLADSACDQITAAINARLDPIVRDIVAQVRTQVALRGHERDCPDLFPTREEHEKTLVELWGSIHCAGQPIEKYQIVNLLADEYMVAAVQGYEDNNNSRVLIVTNLARCKDVVWRDALLNPIRGFGRDWHNISANGPFPLPAAIVEMLAKTDAPGTPWSFRSSACARSFLGNIVEVAWKLFPVRDIFDTRAMVAETIARKESIREQSENLAKVAKMLKIRKGALDRHEDELEKTREGFDEERARRETDYLRRIRVLRAREEKMVTYDKLRCIADDIREAIALAEVDADAALEALDRVNLNPTAVDRLSPPPYAEKSDMWPDK